jgi:hypothetical protein
MSKTDQPESRASVTIAFRIPVEMAVLIDALIEQRQKQLSRFAKPLSRSDVARDLLELGLQAIDV